MKKWFSSLASGSGSSKPEKSKDIPTLMAAGAGSTLPSPATPTSKTPSGAPSPTSPRRDSPRAAASSSSSSAKTGKSRRGDQPSPSQSPGQASQAPQQTAPKSAFFASAQAAASAGLNWPERLIDEHTDMSTLTDTEIMRLMEGMDGDVLNKPLITGPVPLLAVRQEYLHGSHQVLRKLQWLESNGWDQVWRARGDGDCFYRSFTLAYLLRILYAPNPSADASVALHTIQANIPIMERVGFQADLLEEFLDPLVSTIAWFMDPPPGKEPSEYNLLQVLQDNEKSNSIVVALRLVTGAYIRTHPGDFAPFLFSPITLNPLSPEEFCRQEVEPCGKEADHAQIMALAAALNVPLRVAYLDRSNLGEEDVINWVEFGEDGASADTSRPLTLLYRPGHFDVVTKDQIMQHALEQSQHTGPPIPEAGPSNSAAGSSAAALSSATAGASAAAAPDPVLTSLTSEAPGTPSTALKGRPEDIVSARLDPGAPGTAPINAPLTPPTFAPEATQPSASTGTESASPVAPSSVQSQTTTAPSIQLVPTDLALDAAPIPRMEPFPQSTAAVTTAGAGTNPIARAPATGGPTPLGTAPAEAAATDVAAVSPRMKPPAAVSSATAPGHSLFPGASGAPPTAAQNTAPVPGNTLETLPDEESPAKSAGPPVA